MTNRRIPRKEEFPIVVQRGPTGLKGTAKIYFTPVKANGKQYASFTVSYYSLGKRVRERFEDYGTAYGVAEEKAIQLSQGEVSAVGMKSADQRLHASALQILEPLGISLESALREYCEAKLILGPTSLLEAANFHARYASTITKKGSLRKILEAMLAALEADKRSAYHIRDIKRHVGRFVDYFAGREIEDFSTSDIDDWLRTLKMAPRSRDNHRNSVHNFFHFARSEGYLLKDRPTAADDTKQIDEGGKENEVFTVEEARKILAHVHKRLIPTLVIKLFSGVRTEEMAWISWENIKFDQDVIIVRKAEAKTKGRRIIPLTPNLKAWLEPYRETRGRIADRWINPETLGKAWTNAVKKAGDSYKKNAMRNSYISYRVAETKNIQLVALEAGNSPGVIQSDYLELVTPQDAAKWFAIYPSGQVPLS
jgi:integrase